MVLLGDFPFVMFTGVIYLMRVRLASIMWVRLLVSLNGDVCS